MNSNANSLKKSLLSVLTKTFMMCLLFVMVAIPARADGISSSSKNLGVVEVSGGSLNIRSEASSKGTKVATIVNHGGVIVKKTVNAEDGKWYYISSGSVTGYVKAAYIATGDKAASLAKKYGKASYNVNTSALRLRKSASTTASTLVKLPDGCQVKILDSGIKAEGFTWAKVSATVSGKSFTGYVASKYLSKGATLTTAVAKNVPAKETNKKETNKKETNKKETTKKETSKKESSKKENQTTTSSTGSKKGSSIAATAKNYIGKVRYVYGGTSLSKGTDCSGFTKAIYSLHGISIPRTASSQAKAGKSISASSLQPGDLVFYSKGGRISHVAIYVGGGKIVHNTNPKGGVKMNNMNYTKPCKYVTYR